MNRRAWVWATAGILVVVYVYGLSGSINKPFATDEIYYAGWAHGLADHLSPTYYSGEYTNYDGEEAKLVEPISHPLMHFNLLAVMVATFGLHYWSLRLLGVIFFGLLLVFLHRAVFRESDDATTLVVVVAALLVLNPIFMQQHLVLAIEAQVFWLPVVIFLYLFHQESDAPPRVPWFPYLKSCALIVVLLWFKETNLPIYCAACGSYLLLRRQFSRIAPFGLAVVVGVLVFWGSWVLYCKVTAVDVYSWWDFTVMNKMVVGAKGLPAIILKKGMGGALLYVGAGWKLTLAWVSPVYVVIVLAAVGRRIRQCYRREVEVDLTDLFLLFAFFVFLFSKIIRPTDDYLKYEVPGHVALIIFTVRANAQSILRHRTAICCAVLLGVAVGVAWTPFYDDRILAFPASFWAPMLVGAALSLLAWALVHKTHLTRGSGASAAVALVFCLAAVNMPLHIRQAQATYTTGESWGNYGENLREAMDWLKANMRNGDGLAAFKDIQFNMRYVEGMTESLTWEVRVFTRDKSDKSIKQRLMRAENIAFVVVSRFSGSARGKRFLRAQGYAPVWTSGQYAIWRPTPSEQ